MAALRPEVAALFELTGTATRLHVPRLGGDVDLTEISVADAEALVSLPGGFEWLRRKPVALPEVALPEVALPESETGPAV